MEDVLRLDDPMAYFYNVRLIEEGAQDVYEQENGHGMNGVQGAGGEEEDEKWQGSVMEVQADKLS